MVKLSEVGFGKSCKSSKLIESIERLSSVSISKEVIELHGGRIWVESEENVGSKFSFELPYREFVMDDEWEDV